LSPAGDTSYSVHEFIISLLGLWAYLRLPSEPAGSAVQRLPSAPVVLPSDDALYPDGHDGSGAVLH